MPKVICGCGKSVETRPEWAGQWIACPGCGGTLYAPFPGDKPGPPVPVIEVLPATVPAVAAPTKTCPWCAETIAAAAAVCPLCKGDANARPTATPPIRVTATPVASTTDGGGMAPLIVGILGFIVCQLFAPVAWAMGSSYEKDCRTRGVAPSGAGRAGKILGIVGTVLLFIVLAFFVLGTILTAAGS
jgi:hypothetical protein